MKDFEHLRHGVPLVEDDCEATQTTSTSSSQTSKSISLLTTQELSVPSKSEALQAPVAALAPVIAHAPIHQQIQAPSAAEAVHSLRSSYSYSSPMHEGPLPGGIEYGLELMEYSHENPDRNATTMTRELAVRRWLVDSGYMMDSGYRYPVLEHGELMQILTILFVSCLSI